MKKISFLVLLTMAISANVFGKPSDRIHCTVERLKQDAQGGKPIAKFCSEVHTNQHDKKSRDFDIVEHWKLTIFSEHPTFRWQLSSYDEILFKGGIYLKLDVDFEFEASALRFHCRVDKNPCNEAYKNATEGKKTHELSAYSHLIDEEELFSQPVEATSEESVE